MSEKTVLVILAHGFEEVEAVAPVDVLRRAGVDVTIASIEASLFLKGRNGMTLVADDPLDTVKDSEFDLIFLPGGPGTARVRDDARVIERVRRQAKGSGELAAICAAPLILHEAGVLGDRYTGHSSIAGELPDLRDEAVVFADGIITSRGAGTAVALGLALVGHLCGSDVAREIGESIHA